MKKLVTIALLCAMLLSCFAGCAMQKGEVDVDIVNVQNVGDETIQKAPTTVPTENVSKWTGGDVPNNNALVTISAEGVVALSKDIPGADISWFNPKEKNHVMKNAAEFVGFLALRQVTNNTTFQENYKAYTGEDLDYFDGHTFTLAENTNIDLGGVDIKVYDSKRMFGGTFDGGNNVIFNYKQNGVNSGSKGFFSRLTGSACLKNFSLIGGTVEISGQADKANQKDGGIYSITNNAKAIFGVAVGHIDSVEGETITVQNVYTDCVVKNTSNTKVDVFNKVGGVIGLIEGTGSVVIDNCASKSSLQLNGTGTSLTLSEDKKSYSTDESTYGQYTGGVISTISNSGKDTVANVDVTISNCSFSGTINSANTYVAGILAHNASTKTVKIENCVNNGTISSTKAYVAGVLGVHASTAGVTIKDCINNGSITSGSSDAAGILAYVSNTGDVTLDGCVNNGKAKATSRAAGMISYYNVAGNLTVTNCENGGDLEAAGGYVGGMIGRADKVKALVISNCTVTKEAYLNTGVNTGGIIGYINGNVTSVKIVDCKFEGVMSTGRGSGGIAGYPHAKTMDFTMTGCIVTGTLNLNAGDKSNNSLGGLIGRFDAKTATISDCEFAGVLNANFDPKAGDGNLCVAGGLIGYAFNASNADGALELKLSNNKVSGTLNFTENDLDNSKESEAEIATPVVAEMHRAIYVAYVADSAKIEYGEGMVFDVENTTLSSTSAVILGDHAPVALKLVGKQYKDNEDGTHDLRIVLGADEDAFRTSGVAANVEALGIKASLYYKAEGEKVAKFEDESFYVTKVYKSIKGGDEEYTAASKNCDYLYTLVVKNIPADLNVLDGSLEIDLAGFASMMVDGVEVIQAMDTYPYGEIVIEEPAA